LRNFALFAYFAVNKPSKPLTAEDAKDAKITQRVEPGILQVWWAIEVLASLRRFEQSLKGDR